MKLTFGQLIAKKRKDKGLTQKDLASRILKEEGSQISAQYLNDIERDRRNPSGDHLIEQFARVLDINEDVLYYLTDGWPSDIRRQSDDLQRIGAAFRRFRQTLRGNE